MFLMISKNGILVHTTVLAIFWIWGIFNKPKNTTKVGKTVNLGNFQKMHPSFQKGGLLEWVSKRGVTICDT